MKLASHIGAVPDVRVAPNNLDDPSNRSVQRETVGSGEIVPDVQHHHQG